MEKTYSRNCEFRPGMVFPEGMQRIALCIEYKGSAFHGFQKQKTASRTVQAALEQAISSVANETVTLVCAGRTDAGVHATNQLVHFDTLASRSMYSWVRGVNTKLPDDVVVKWAHPVGERFHARFSALSRTYRYIFYPASIRPVVAKEMVTWTRYSLNLENMRLAGNNLVGKHDFTSFRTVHCQANNPVRNMEYVRFSAVGKMIVMELKANAFLQHMVRNISGCMIDVGRGVRSPGWIKELLQVKDRTKAAATAPPDGLFLVAVEYPEEFGLPPLELGPDFLSI